MAATIAYMLILTFVLFYSFCGLMVTSGEELKSYRTKRESKFSGSVHFNNPKMLNEPLKGYNRDGYYYDTRQNAVDPKKMGGINIQDEAQRLALRLRILSNQEMRVPTLQKVYDSLDYKKAPQFTEQTVEILAKDIEDKIKKYIKMLKINKQTVELHKIHMRKPVTNRHECCNLPDSQLSFDENYNCEISKKYSCDLIPPSVPKGAFNPGRNLTEVFQQAYHIVHSIKWQYFISTQGVHTEYPAHNFNGASSETCRNAHDSRHRDIYVSTVHPPSKRVLIMIDHGNSLSSNQLNIAKAVSKHILASLSQNDWVGVFGVSSEVVYPRSDNCLNRTLVRFTPENRVQFTRFIDKLQKKELPVDHSMAFRRAFDLIGNHSKNQDYLIIYVSRGLMSSLTDSKDVLETIQQGNRRFGHRVVINTFAVIDDGKPIMYEKNFMENIAEQQLNGIDGDNKAKAGIMRAVNTTHDLSSIIGDFYRPLDVSIPDAPRIFLPQYDEAAGGVVLSVTWPCFYNGSQLLGIVGLDVHLSEVVEKLTYFNNQSRAYAFLLSTKGYTITHPSMARPFLAKQPPVWTDISHYETVRGFDSIRHKILRATDEDPGGLEEMTVVQPREYGVPQSGDMAIVYRHRYIWKKIPKTEFIVVLKVVLDSSHNRVVDDILVPGSEVRYHRLDLVPAKTTCMHLKQLATFDTSTAYLGAQAFVRSFEHLTQIETKPMVTGYMTYINDQTMYLANPAFRPGVRTDIAALSKLDQEWKMRFEHSPYRDYIVRRFAGTDSGVVQMYPGTLLDKKYDHTKRNWYTRAKHYPGLVTLTAPYLDVGGAGYIVTVSHTIYQKMLNGQYNKKDPIAAVLGVDVSLGFFYKQLIQILPLCEERNIRCFIMDDRGYLVAHRGLIEPNGKGPVEQQHITHKEPQVANDILNHQGFVRKKLCNSYSDRTVQRFYQFNTSFQGTLTNLIHGEHCHQYQVTVVPGTNTFLGIVNETCSMMRAFCPCSMVDRLCLNCHRMEQTECECPCECPLEMNYCNGKLLSDEDKNPGCTENPEDIKAVPLDKQITEKLPQCVEAHCSQRMSKMECLGVIDCEWCVYDTDGETAIPRPFCGTQRLCFAGVLGEQTPYNDRVPNAELLTEHEVIVKSTPVGPVAGGIMGCFLVLALAVYCYRHHVHRQAHQYITAAPDACNRSPIENEPDDIDQPDEIASGHTNMMSVAFENPAAISPYRINTTYRRPTGGESDHGYSTMTPHDDSEQASTTCAEPLLISRDRYRPPAPQIKGMIPPPPTSRRSRSPTPPQTIPEQTFLLTERNVSEPPGVTVLPETPGVTILPEPPGQTVLYRPSGESHNVVAQVHMIDTH